MTLSERLSEYVRACFTAIWIESHEHEDALTEMVQLCRQQDPPWRLATWDIESGLRLAGEQSADHAASQDPLAAIRCLSALANGNGVSARLFGTLLSYLSDKETDVFVVASANRIDHLPAEFTRAERLDGVFFLDLPGPTERHAIWQLYLRQFELDAGQRLPADEGWTGAEIRACCRLAALLDLPLVQATQHVVPVAVTAAESIAGLRRWASGRCLSAGAPGIYRQSGSTGPRRRVTRGGPSPN